MPQFRNLGDEVDLFAPADRPDSMRVEPGQVITVAAPLANTQPEDAYLVGAGDDARLWPHTQWELVKDQAPPVAARARAAATSEEN